MFHGQAGQAGQAKHGKHMLGKAYVMFVCIYTNNAMLCIGGTLLQLETPSGHIWNVLIWCSSKLSWRSIWFKRTRFIIVCACRRHGNIIFLGKAYVMFVCIYTNNAMLCIGGTLLQLETPSGHIWNVLIWCSRKLSWRSIWFKRMRFIVVGACQRHGNIIFVERKPCFGCQKL